MGIKVGDGGRHHSPAAEPGKFVTLCKADVRRGVRLTTSAHDEYPTNCERCIAIERRIARDAERQSRADQVEAELRRWREYAEARGCAVESVTRDGYTTLWIKAPTRSVYSHKVSVTVRASKHGRRGTRTMCMLWRSPFKSRREKQYIEVTHHRAQVWIRMLGPTYID